MKTPSDNNNDDATRMVGATLEQRAKRGQLSDLENILEAVPDVPPLAGDEK
jgi:hypothetical protein